MTDDVSTPFWGIGAVVRSWCIDAATEWWDDADRGWRAIVVASLVTVLVQFGVAIPW